MKDIGLVLKYLYPSATFMDIQVTDDGTGQKVTKFDTAKFGPMPDETTLAAKEPEAIAFFQSKKDQAAQDQAEVDRLKALSRKDWVAADVKSAVQIWISRQ